MPDAYAAMSPAEFFAELCALYHDRHDPARRRIPADVMKWLDEQLGGLGATRTPRPPSARHGVAKKTPVPVAAKRRQSGSGRPT
jgi:hypothetical protein